METNYSNPRQIPNCPFMFAARPVAVMSSGQVLSYHDQWRVYLRDSDAFGKPIPGTLAYNAYTGPAFDTLGQATVWAMAQCTGNIVHAPHA